MGHKKVKQIFEEYNYEFFKELYNFNKEFTYLVDRYYELSNKIHELEKETYDLNLLNRLKKHRMQLKDEAYSILLSYKVEKSE